MHLKSSAQQAAESRSDLPPDLVQRAEAAGVASQYQSFDGARRSVSEAALTRALHLIEEVGVRDRPSLPPLHVLPKGEPLVLRWQQAGDQPLQWTLRLLDAAGAAPQCGGSVVRDGKWCTIESRQALAPGYYRIELSSGSAERCELVVTPRQCWLPTQMRQGRRYCGLTVQLYALRSASNCGIGDFGDLMRLVETVAPQGAAFIGLNPLHALFAERPQAASPYSPSSRTALNPLYLDVHAIVEESGCDSAQALWRSEAMHKRLSALRASELVDYTAVAAAKHEILGAVWRHFEQRELAAGTSCGRDFETYMADRAGTQVMHAVFETLQAHLASADPSIRGWPQWPERFRDPHGDAVGAFRETHASEIRYRAWLQWMAEQQLAAAQTHAMRCGMAIGLYRDLAVGVDPGGSETWLQPALFAMDMRIGAPPDLLQPDGQDWGLAPPHPVRMVDARLQLYIDTVRANMRSAGALRMDHVMALMRLWWTCEEGGTYVSYPMDDLMGILALESHRHQCLVVGEDLGTVHEQVRSAMEARSILSCKPLMFECQDDGSVTPTERWPEKALATFGTHDLPTLAGFWQGCDIASAASAGGDPARLELLRSQRQNVRAGLLAALAEYGLLDGDQAAAVAASTSPTPALVRAVHLLLARTPSLLVGVALEDLTGQVEQVNQPGTTEDQHPNWRRKLAASVEELALAPALTDVLAALRRELLNQAA